MSDAKPKDSLVCTTLGLPDYVELIAPTKTPSKQGLPIAYNDI
ncbi:hypothetical protein C3B55_00122 [Candidatus Pseudomonas adelgestsugas]|uniref:Uncharacterized protein n=1 Tax=Candidatus Pseudomonas adelgestsugas TaxID=1302376 RepID=A0ABX5R760_9PSED|nr:hypothetical protein C3B55_00122 [Candidatus Pseudomonas adelgestsugas]